MIITTTNNIEGLNIKKYLSIVSGTEIYLVGGLIGGGLVNQEGLYTNALQAAMKRMEEKAEKLGANAIVGVSTNFTSPGGLNSMIVAVTGTAVLTDEREQAMERNAKAQAEKEAAVRREQERREEQYRRLISNGETSSQMERFLAHGESCTRASQILELWESLTWEPGALIAAMDKKLRDTARVEKLYGTAAANVPKLLEELRRLMAAAGE